MSPPARELPARRPVILVADRNEIIRKVVHTMLTRQGSRVLLASRAERAVSILARFSGRLDLMIVDAAMTVADVDIVDHVSRTAPRIPLLLMVSHPREQNRDRSRLASLDFISKPFTQAILLGKIRELMPQSGLANLYKIVSRGH